VAEGLVVVVVVVVVVFLKKKKKKVIEACNFTIFVNKINYP